MTNALWLLAGVIFRLFRSRRRLLLENLALRQQLAALKRTHPRPRLVAFDKLFWVLARRLWSGWKQALLIVTPETVVRWHRSGFALYWRAISKARRLLGRKRISKEVRELIFRMVVENPRWGAPRIHGELLMLGFDVSERSISRWMQRAPRDPEPAKRWLAFLRNHREVIAAMDFFTVPTLTFSVLHCFFVIDHGRRRILHFNVTRHPTSSWIVQQLREAFPYQSAPRLLIFDRDAKYGLEVPIAVRSMAIRPVRTSLRSPWQNGIAERWVESCRRDLLDHVIALNERHLKRLVSEYVRYYHEDRAHLGLDKQTPAGRVQSMFRGPVVSRPRLGGLHHRYDRAA
ncbi:MAG: integrase [Acidobacteria bacterium]|nr:MAG: integrase [Acidobacteriota bacterium]